MIHEIPLATLDYLRSKTTDQLREELKLYQDALDLGDRPVLHGFYNSHILALSAVLAERAGE